MPISCLFCLSITGYNCICCANLGRPASFIIIDRFNFISAIQIIANSHSNEVQITQSHQSHLKKLQKITHTHKHTHMHAHVHAAKKKESERKTTLYLCVWIFYVHIGPKLSYNKLKQIFALKNLTHFFLPQPKRILSMCACVCVYSFCVVCCVLCGVCRMQIFPASLHWHA